MFKNLKYEGCVDTIDHLPYKFNLRDTCFQCDIYASSKYMDNISLIDRLMDVYSKRKLNVLKNVVLYYRFIQKDGFHVPEILNRQFRLSKRTEFRTHYYPLLTKYYFKK